MFSLAGGYYSVELMPGLITKGQYPDSFPMLPRILLRNCDLRGTTCLDVGSMEGLIPVVMCRQGAKTVLATDAMIIAGKKWRRFAITIKPPSNSSRLA